MIKLVRSDTWEAKLARIEALERDLAELQAIHQAAVDGLRAMPVVESYHQPVLLMGPSGVGKTSLLRQLEARWKPRVMVSPPSTSAPEGPVSVPIHDLRQAQARTHPVVDVPADLEAHLALDFYDFPGELSGRERIVQSVCDHTRESFAVMGLGVVLICLFNADEATLREPPDASRRYYDEETVGRIRDLVVLSQARIERLILVFNKVDKLRRARPRFSDADLREECREFFLTHFQELEKLTRRPARAEGVRASREPAGESLPCFVTMLDQEKPDSMIQGASEVLGAASAKLLRRFGQSDRALVSQLPPPGR